MTKILFLSILLLSAIASAKVKTYLMNIELKINSQKIANFEFETKSKKKTAHTENYKDGKIEIIAAAQPNLGTDEKTIQMNFEIVKIDAQGKRVTIAKPEIVAKENTTAEIKESNKDQKEEVALIATAKSIVK